MGKRQSMKRKDMPGAREIRTFWAYKLLALGKIADTEQVTDPVVFSSGSYHQCFCCGRSQRLDRAHIKPLWQGGVNAPENLHLLCRGCHIESENLSDEMYWRWFLSTPWRDALDLSHFHHLLRAAGLALPLDTPLDIGTLDVIRRLADFHAAEATMRQMAGIEKAKAQGAFKGRKVSVDREPVRALLKQGKTPTEVSRLTGVSRPTVYRIKATLQ